MEPTESEQTGCYPHDTEQREHPSTPSSSLYRRLVNERSPGRDEDHGYGRGVLRGGGEGGKPSSTSGRSAGVPDKPFLSKAPSCDAAHEGRSATSVVR